MVPWELVDQASVQHSGEQLRLYRRGSEFSIRVDGQELMNSRASSSEQVLGRLSAQRIAKLRKPCVLVGGLGMAYTLAAVLSQLGPSAEVVVAELVPEVVAWNRAQLGHLAGHPLQDARVHVHEADVASLLRSQRASYDAILLDVDNGPQGLTQRDNNWLYSGAGLSAAHTALRPHGLLSVWSARPDPSFASRLQKARFSVEQISARARGDDGGAHHTIWLASRAA